MKKKLAILTVLGSLVCGVTAITFVSGIADPDTSYAAEKSEAGDFVLKPSTATLVDDHYVANLGDNKGNIVETDFTGFTYSDNSFVSAKASKSTFTNVDPFGCGINSINVSLSFEEATSSLNYLVFYFSYNELNLNDIFTGSYQDLVFASFEIRYGETYSVNSINYPDILRTRYVLGLIINGDRDSISLTSLTINTPCVSEIDPPVEKGEYKSFKKDYKSIVEGFGYTYFTDTFFFGNGSFNFRCSSEFPGYQFNTVQNSMGYSNIMMYFMNSSGYQMTLQQKISDYQIGIAFQKQVGDDVYSYIVTLTMVSLSTDMYASLNIMCTTSYPYMGGASTWPSQDITNAGASQELVQSFFPLELSNATYTFGGKDPYSFGKNAYMVMIQLSDISLLEDELATYLAQYEELSSEYTVKEGTYSHEFTVTKIGTDYTFEISVSSSMVMVMLTETVVFDHLPLAEYAEFKHYDRLLTASLSGVFVYNDDYGQGFIGTTTEANVQAFINQAKLDFGYSFMGNLDRGVLLENPTTYCDNVISISFNKIDTNKYEIDIRYGSYSESITLRNYLVNTAGASRFVELIQGDDNTQLLDSTFERINYGLGDYHGYVLGVQGDNASNETAIVGLFLNNSNFVVSEKRSHFYRVAFVDHESYHEALFIHFELLEGGMFVNFYVASDFINMEKTYVQANNILSASEYAPSYVPLKRGLYTVEQEDSATYLYTVGTFKEISEIVADFNSEISKNTNFVYNHKNFIYLDSTNNISVSCRVVGSPYYDNSYRLEIRYSSISKAYDEFKTLENSGISSLPLMANFPSLPELEGELAYSVISATPSEVKIYVNRDFQIHNYYYKKCTENGFINSSKDVGDAVYCFDHNGEYSGGHEIYTFRVLQKQSLSDFMNELSAYDYLYNFVETLHLSEDYLYTIDTLVLPVQYRSAGYLTFSIYGISGDELAEYLLTLDPPRQEYEQYAMEDYNFMFSIGQFRDNKASVSIEIYS